MSQSTSFSRDRFTWMAYLLAAFFTYLQASWGPLMPFLRDELKLSYTTAGLHFSAFAFGMILAGLSSCRINYLWGSRFAMWGGAAGMALGVLFLIISHTVVMTILSALLMGLLGSILNNTVQANISERHDRYRATALTEMSLFGSASAGLSPLMIGGFTYLGLGWRPALSIAAIALLIIFLQCRQVKIPISRPSRPDNDTSQSLSLPFWYYWITLFFGVSVGYCLVFWGADFLRTAVGLPRGDAASAMSVFLFAGMIGRAFGSHLSQKKSEECLVIGAIGVTTTGFLLLWLAPIPWLNIVGLLITGVGAANFYPLLLSAAISSTQQQVSWVTARLSIGAGLAILIMPLLLGWIADQLELKKAFGLVIVLLVGITVLLLCAYHLKQKHMSRCN
jgi:MFS family permease